MSHESLNNSIRRLLFEHGELTQEELAKKVKVTRQTIVALEANKYVPSLVLAMRIAKVFRIPVEQVFELSK